MRKISAERNYELSDPKIVIKRRKFMNTSLDANVNNNRFIGRNTKQPFIRNSYCVPISCALLTEF